MALSNIFREPRREITESVVGLLVLAAITVPTLWVDYRFATFVNGLGSAPHMPIPLGMIVGMFTLLAGGFLLILLLMVTHLIGEGICNALQNRGVHLRPRRQY